MIDDVGDLRIIQHSLERWHGRRINGAADILAVQSVQDGIDLSGGVSIKYSRVALEWRERTSNALACGLMTSRTVGRVKLGSLGRIEMIRTQCGRRRRHVRSWRSRGLCRRRSSGL